MESLVGKKLGNYEILRELGRGGMGIVYKAHEQSLQRVVALKVLASHLKADPAYVKRFVREARAAAQLDHPNIVQIYAVGEENGIPYIAMQYVKGRTLAERIQQEGQLPLSDALSIVRQTAEALVEAHRRSIIHRDIKPQNIMLDEAGRVKVMDFGLAKLAQAKTALTQDGAWLGTPLYMAPEQARGGQADARSDIYALGVTLYEMLAGSPPFQADTPVALLYQIIHEPFPDVRLLNRDVPPAVSQVIARMTARNPEDRYPSAEALCAELPSLIDGTATVAGKPSPGPKMWMQALARMFRDPDSRRVRWPAAGIAVGVLFVLCVVGAWKLGGQGGSHPSDQAPQAPGSVEVVASPPAPAIEPAPVSVPAPAPAPEPAVAPAMPKAKEGTRAGETTAVDLGGGEKLELVWIPPGSFVMGSPKGEQDRKNLERDALFRINETQHRVTLTEGFWLGKYEVTQAQWEAVMWSNPSSFKGDKNLPVENVSWDDCQEYIRKLNRKGEWGFRLPTESEWEYACRAGTTGAYGFGNDAGALGEYAWYDGNSAGKTHEVGQKKPNAWGLYDMHANVWEWCEDWCGKYLIGRVTDPRGASSGQGRVLRGGSWILSQGDCRSAYRNWSFPSNRSTDFGFRLCRSPASR